MLKLTTKAITQIEYLLSLRKVKPLGMKVYISTKGCSGISYDMDYVYDNIEGDKEIKHDHFSLFVKKSHMLWLLDTEIDYEEDFFQPGFRFKNDKMKGKCNCGESFIF